MIDKHLKLVVTKTFKVLRYCKDYLNMTGVKMLQIDQCKNKIQKDLKTTMVALGKEKDM